MTQGFTFHLNHSDPLDLKTCSVPYYSSDPLIYKRGFVYGHTYVE